MKPALTTLLIAASIYGIFPFHHSSQIIYLGLYHTADRMLTAQLTVGPYEVTAAETDEYNRSNITESQVGLPVQYVITVTKDDVPVAGVRLDTWFANASGVYSGVSAENTLGEDYLRGWQLTDENGQLTFDGIFPGAYSGRTVHVHFRARMYDENDTVIYNNTTQLFFPQDVIDEVMDLDAYEDSVSNWDTMNSADAYYTEENLVNLTGNTTTGFVATYTIELPLTETSQSSSDSGSSAVPSTGSSSGSSGSSGSGSSGSTTPSPSSSQGSGKSSSRSSPSRTTRNSNSRLGSHGRFY